MRRYVGRQGLPYAYNFCGALNTILHILFIKHNCTPSNLTVMGKYIQSCMPRMGMWLWRWIKVRYLVTQLCMHKVCYKLDSSQKQNCNIFTQLSGILKVLCPTFYLHTHTYSTMSVRCATELAVSVCTGVVICSCTGEGRQKNMAPNEAELWTYARMGLCEVMKFQQISCMLQLPRNSHFVNQSS